MFGFEKHAVYAGPNNTIGHAELTLGSGMVMLGSVQDNDFRRFTKQPNEIGGAETRSISLVVPDADAIYARAKEAGAEILFDIEHKPFEVAGSRAVTRKAESGM